MQQQLAGLPEERKGTLLKARDEDGYTVVHHAAELNHVDVLKLLIFHGAGEFSSLFVTVNCSYECQKAAVVITILLSSTVIISCQIPVLLVGTPGGPQLSTLLLREVTWLQWKHCSISSGCLHSLASCP